MIKCDNFNENDYLINFKYNVSKITLLLAFIITFIFLILRLINFIPENLTATLNTAIMTVFFIVMYILIKKYKEKFFLVQMVSYFAAVTFIYIQTLLLSNNTLLPVWIDFIIMTAFIVTDKKVALIIALYSIIALIYIKSSNIYLISIYSYVTLFLSILAFTILGYLISLQLEHYNNKFINQSKKLEELALLDELTGIYNRRAFFKFGQAIFTQAMREHKPLTIIMIDLDHFKKINDTYGHKAGDIVLKNFVNIIKNIIRKNDFFARIGGEEFVLILYDTNEQTVQKIIDKLLRNIRTTPILLDNNKSVNITASLGIYTFIPNEKNSLHEALINADKALYVAKKTGRNKAVFY